MKQISCGILIFNSQNELFVCHSTGNNFFDIPKGLKDENETFIQTAIRELMESGRCVYTYFGGSFIEIPHKEGAEN